MIKKIDIVEFEDKKLCYVKAEWVILQFILCMKLIVKRIRRDVDYSALLEAGKIIIENSRFCWHFIGTEENIGMMAMRIIFRIYDYYQDEVALPETVSIHY